MCCLPSLWSGSIAKVAAVDYIHVRNAEYMTPSKMQFHISGFV